jgi:hypothetical protein
MTTKTKKEKIEQPTDMKNVPLGTLMRDKVTGWEGIAVAKVTYMNGCVQYGLKPQHLDKDGKTMDAPTFDCEQLEVIGQGIAPKEPVEKKPTGGVMPDTPKIGRELMRL